MSRFQGNDQGKKLKITAGCFDSTLRRLITAAGDGSVSIWNFSNGQQLTELRSAVTGRKVDTEVTALLSLHDPNDMENPPEE